MPRARSVAIAIALSLSTFACRDVLDPPVPQRSPEPLVPQHVIGRYECAVEVASQQVTCAHRPLASGGAAYAILGNPDVKLRSFNVGYDSTLQVLHADITVQNRLPEPMGTPDGTTVTGVKVFFETGPTVAAYNNPGDTGSVTIRNADGYAAFTRPNQPYYFYDQILAPNDTSPPKNWKWNCPIVVKTFNFTLLVSAELQSEVRIPEHAPSGDPAWLYHPDSVVSDNTHITGTYTRDVVQILFSPTALQPRRRALIDSVGGVVVGGNRLGNGPDGYYYVKVPADSTGAAVAIATARLQGRPGVLSATPHFTDTYAYVSAVQPDDGANFRRWRMYVDSADGQNWAPEVVAAPLAWGCSRGDTAARIAAVDADFESVADLTVNVDPSHGWPNYGALGATAAQNDHGTSTASIIAARGNNNTGVTGLMWNTRLALYDAAAGPTGTIVYDRPPGRRPCRTWPTRSRPPRATAQG
jgi:hypothetical protein